MGLEKSALVLFSGGQDSTICLTHALTHYQMVETIGFDYGQRHAIELDCRGEVRAGILSKFPKWHDKLGADHLLSLPALAQIGGTALIGAGEIKMQANNLPTSFVPGRNLLFLTYAAALAYRRGLDVLIGGMCETDYSGYPDCRAKTLTALKQALQLGMETGIEIETPLMQMDKAQSWALAHDLGGAALIDLIIEHSHSCYHGVRDQLHDWGYGCDNCPACELRKQGYEVWRNGL